MDRFLLENDIYCPSEIDIVLLYRCHLEIDIVLLDCCCLGIDIPLLDCCRLEIEAVAVPSTTKITRFYDSPPLRVYVA